MSENIYKTNGLIFSQSILIALVKKGLTREEAYRLVQKRALESWNSNGDFKQAILDDNTINKSLSSAEIEECFNLKNQIKNIDIIYKKVGL